MNNNDFITDIIIKTAEEVMKAYHSFKNQESGITFPTYRDDDIIKKGEIRISEQELRFLFARELFHESILFSVETPTMEKYHKDKEKKDFTERSGNIDLVIYENNLSKWKYIIEFKHGDNPKDIDFDFEKLYKEKGNSIFFQIIEREKYNDGKTVDNLWAKYKSAAKSAFKQTTDDLKRVPVGELIIAIVILMDSEIHIAQFEEKDLIIDLENADNYEKIKIEKVKKELIHNA